MSLLKKEGTSDIGLLFYGLKAPYFARGAVKSIEISFEEYKGEYFLVGDGTRVARTSNNGRLEATDIDQEIREKTFAATKLPYAEHGITAEHYINLSAYQKLEIELDSEDVNEEETFGCVKQEWAQLGSDEHTPVPRFIFNLFKEEEYVPPQIRKERAEQAAKEAAAAMRQNKKITTS